MRHDPILPPRDPRASRHAKLFALYRDATGPVATPRHRAVRVVTPQVARRLQDRAIASLTAPTGPLTASETEG